MDGVWKTTLTAWVQAGGTVLLHGERAAAAVSSEWFGKAWVMDGDLGVFSPGDDTPLEPVVSPFEPVISPLSQCLLALPTYLIFSVLLCAL